MLMQFAVACTKANLSKEDKIGITSCLSSFTEKQTSVAYQHVYEMFVSERKMKPEHSEGDERPRCFTPTSGPEQ